LHRPLVQVCDVVIDQVCALLGFGGQLLERAGGGEVANRGRVQAQLASDRCLRQAAGTQLVYRGVLFTHPGDDLLLG
jgi:hypothetical protein